MKTQTSPNERLLSPDVARGVMIAGMLLLLVLPATARVYWGGRAGISRSSLVQKIDLNYRSGSIIGYSLAGLADIPFYERFSFRPELALTCQGGSFLSGLNAADTYLLKNEFRSYSLQTPLDIAFNIPISGVKLAVYGGPALDFYLFDNLKMKELEEGTAGTEAGGKPRPFDFAVNMGISVEYKKVFFSIDVLTGTLDRRHVKVENESSVYQNNITFSLGYIFR
jgi:hypothetical protein